MGFEYYINISLQGNYQIILLYWEDHVHVSTPRVAMDICFLLQISKSNTAFLLYCWLHSWWKKKYFWKRFTCMWFHGQPCWKVSTGGIFKRKCWVYLLVCPVHLWNIFAGKNSHNFGLLYKFSIKWILILMKLIILLYG